MHTTGLNGGVLYMGGVMAVGGPDSLLLHTPVTLRGEEFHTVSDFVVAEHRVHRSPRHPSRLLLPVVPSDRSGEWIDNPWPRSG